MADPTYHFWLKPSGGTYDLFARIVRDLANELGVEAFEPHVTLLAYLDGPEDLHVERAGLLAARVRPFEMRLTEPAWLDEHFRSLFMLVDQTPAVMACHSEAALLYGRSGEPFMPHVSLVYGMFPEDTKRTLASRLPAGVRTTFEVKSVILLRSDSTEPKDWHEIREVPLEP
jgi:2'-5' RNA ligase